MGEKKDTGAAGTARRKRFILVVDNSHRDAGYAAILLQNLGYNSTVVRSGEEAVEFSNFAAPALVLSELVLPGINGLDLFERLSGDPGRPAVPLIITTKFTDIETEDHCRRLGCAACLNKPVQPADLFRAVQQTLEPTPRQNIRIPVHLVATIDGGTSGTEFVNMLSDEGLFVQTLAPRPVGTTHTLTFLLADHVIRVDARVLYANTFDEGPQKELGIGMKFLNLSPIDRDVVQAYIRDHVTPGIAPAG